MTISEYHHRNPFHFIHCLQIVLNSLQRYKPCLHITEIPTNNHSNLTSTATTANNNGGTLNIDDFPTMTFEFPETSFIAVTAYQSEEVCLFICLFYFLFVF